MTDFIHDHFFKKVFSDINNICDFLAIALPEEVKRYLEKTKRSELMTTFVEKIRQEGEQIVEKKGKFKRYSKRSWMLLK